MGMFDFVSSIGKKLFGDDAEAAEKIQEYIEGGPYQDILTST